MSARSVPVALLPIHLRDSAKGEQTAVALDAAAKQLIDELHESGGAAPMVDAAIRAIADVYSKAATDTRRFISRGTPQEDGE